MRRRVPAVNPPGDHAAEVRGTPHPPSPAWTLAAVSARRTVSWECTPPRGKTTRWSGRSPAGDNDPRCPIRQIENYLERLAKRDVPYAFYRYDAGHGSLVIAETIRQTAAEVHFAMKAVGLA